MASLWFKSVRVSLDDEYGRPSTELELLLGTVQAPELPRRKTVLTYRVVPDAETRVGLATGERLRDLEGVITVHPSDSASPVANPANGLNHIGMIHYTAAVPAEPDIRGEIPAGYFIEAVIPKLQFDDLLAVAPRGRIPPEFIVDVEGMTHPDEFSCAWDNKAAKQLPVTRINFLIPLAMFESGDPQYGEEKHHFMPPTQWDVRHVAQSLLGTTERLERLNQKLTWLTVALVGIGLLVLLRWLRVW